MNKFHFRSVKTDFVLMQNYDDNSIPKRERDRDDSAGVVCGKI
uniref:Clone 1688 transcribed RNA sequence n=1 Tax=Plectreurys tristis TaxID=33319 RepID=A0A0C4W4E5_PLETR|nr:hypothetical protein [Plectreurys tristis]